MTNIKHNLKGHFKIVNYQKPFKKYYLWVRIGLKTSYGNVLIKEGNYKYFL